MMNKIQYLQKLSEFEMLMDEVVSKSSELFGSVSESEITESLYKVMNEVKEIIEEEV